MKCSIIFMISFLRDEMKFASSCIPGPVNLMSKLICTERHNCHLIRLIANLYCGSGRY